MLRGKEKIHVPYRVFNIFNARLHAFAEELFEMFSLESLAKSPLAADIRHILALLLRRTGKYFLSPICLLTR